MRIPVIVLAILLFSYHGSAQDTTNQKNKIILIGLKAKLNGERLSGSELKTQIYKTPSAITDFKKYKTSLGLAYGSGALVLGSVFFYSNKNDEPSITGPIISIVSSAAAVYFLLKAKSRLKKSVARRNLNY